MELLIFSFLAGVLTILAPCVLPLLPVIIGGSVGQRTWTHPALITFSLGISIIFFTLLLKVSTLLLTLPQSFWQSVSGTIIIFMGVITIFPHLWESIAGFLELSPHAQNIFSQAHQKKGWLGTCALGAALGPIFSSCSPTFALILAIVLPESLARGIFHIIAYTLGLSVMMFGIAYFGQRLVLRLKYLANPHGIFKKTLGGIFILVGLAIITGYDKKIQARLLDLELFDVTQIETKYFLNQFHRP